MEKTSPQLGWQNLGVKALWIMQIKKFIYYMFVDSDIIVKKGLLINIVSFIQEKII